MVRVNHFTSVATVLALFGMVAMSSGGASQSRWETVRAKFGFDQNDPEIFQLIPRTLSEALEKGWVYLLPSGADGKGRCENDIREMKFHGTPLVKNISDVSLISLFDSQGNLAGLQSYMLQTELLATTQDFFRYDYVPMIQNGTVYGKKYFVVTIYSTEPSNICSSGNETSVEDTENGLWLQVGPRHDIFEGVPMLKTSSVNQGYSEDPCMDYMGFHGWYNFSHPALDCTGLRPIFLLYSTEGKLQGYGITLFGMANSPVWEHPPVQATRRTIRDIPKCLEEKNISIGISGLHVYLFDKPQQYKCPPEEGGTWSRGARRTRAKMGMK